MAPARPVALCMGTFDLLHPGHINLLREACKLGSVTVALNTDNFVYQYKGRYPIMKLENRMKVLEAIRYVDDVIVNTGCWDARPAILEAKPRWIVHGDDWVGESYMKQLNVTPEWLNEHDIGIVYVPYTRGISTSVLIDECAAV